MKKISKFFRPRQKSDGSGQAVFSFVAGLCVGVVLVASASAALKGSAVFPDVESGSYYDDAVGEMNSLGIITGYQDGRFGPNDPVTRAQAAVLLKRLRDEILGVAPSAPAPASSSSSSSSSVASSSSSSSRSTVSVPDEGSIRFTTNAFKVDEDTAQAKITLIRTGGNKGVVSVKFATAAGTASDGADYVSSDGVISFADGETSRFFMVDIVNDSEPDGDETVGLTLSDVEGGAILGTPIEATLTIEDDDGGDSSEDDTGDGRAIIEFSALEYSPAEDGGDMTVTVVRRNNTGGQVSVSYSTGESSVGVPATESIDYVPASGTLTFANGEDKKTFTVEIKDDGSDEGKEAFKIALNTPTDENTKLGNKEAIVYIIDTDTLTFGSGSISFTDSKFIGVEGLEAEVKVKRIGGADGEATVQYETKEAASAAAGDDYTSVTGTLTFAHGEAMKTFYVPIKKDTVADRGETFQVRLFNVTKAELSTPDQAIIETDE